MPNLQTLTGNLQCATRSHGLSMGVLKLTSRSENIRPSPISTRNPPLYQYSNATYVQRTIVPWHLFTLASRLLCTRIPNHGRTTLLQLAGTVSTVRPKRSYLFVLVLAQEYGGGFLFAMLPSCEFPDRYPFLRQVRIIPTEAIALRKLPKSLAKAKWFIFASSATGRISSEVPT